MKMIQFNTNLRMGQELFNFLEWLHTEKGIDTNQSHRLADTFHLTDEEFNNYLEEYNEKNI